MEYYISVFGCQMNISDSERVASVLESAKCKETKNINETDLIVVVMCSVRQSAVDRVHGLVEKFKKLKKETLPAGRQATTILTGCILKKDRKKFAKGFDYIVDIKEIAQIGKIARQMARECDLKRTSQGDFARSREAGKSPRIERAAAGPRALAEDHFPSDSGYIQITTGCNNFCAYCVVPYTRGREISRPVNEIISEVKNLVKRGCKEIWLLGQNVNSYKDKNINFPKLLKIVNDIPGDFKLNFTSSHPKDFSDELIATMVKCKKLSMDLNLPIQSGDNEVLKRMNRPYTVAQYKTLVKKVRKALPSIRLSTDIIVGFPGETKKQFNNTVKTLKEIGYGVAFINKYSPRAGTAAAKMKDDVPWAEKKRREKILIDLINAK
ncbi:MAG: MiaB/RimO family radical SAM methylthiotransferase [Candidatus Staskawiczbacteria bacterium]|nr:MiaB/RimO family radical SAM methylthiotransferase [Candidatus Staskawiczbacteria bacterium]